MWRWRIYKFSTIECFHSGGQHLCKCFGTKEIICIRKEFKSHRTGLGHQYGRRFIVLGHQYGRRDVMWKHSICFLMFSTFKFSVVIQRFITSEDVCWSIRNVSLKFLLYRNAFILLYVYHRTFGICLFLSSVHLWLFLIVLHFLTGSVRFIPPPPPTEKNPQHLTQVGRLPVSSYCDKKNQFLSTCVLV